MSIAEFAALLDIHGPDAVRWPDPGAAQRLLAQSPEAQRLLEEARQLDALLSAALATETPAAPIPQLRARVAAALESGISRPLAGRIADWLGNWLTGSPVRPLLAAALPLALGFALGVGLPGSDADQAMLDAMSVIALEQGGYLDEYLELNGSVGFEEG